MKRDFALVSLTALLGCQEPLGSPPDGSVSSSAWCGLPGSVVFYADGKKAVVPGGAAGPDLSWVTGPPGFCVHYFGNVPNARQIRFAPGGEAFVASPSAATTGGGPGGKSALLVLADDDRDGLADAPFPTFLGKLPQTQGMLFTGTSFYYQDGTAVRRLAYRSGQRQAEQPGAPVVDVTAPAYVSLLHWPKAVDIADDGTLYVTNGSDQGEVCYAARPFVGGVLQIDGTPGGTPVVQGLRNPISIRCQRGHNECYGVEMAMDYSEEAGGREKLFRVHRGDDQGYPCCATTSLPYGGVVAHDAQGRPVGAPACAAVSPEVVSWHIGRSPMGLDFEPGAWPAPWQRSVLVGLHGEFGTWTGAKVVALATDPATGAPRRASELSGGDASALADFATGWDDGKHAHGRPDDVAFASDGRLFVTNDVNGDILWFAPVALERPAGGGAP